MKKMNAVERLGSYISRGVYTVSGPFHPFGGAVDIIVVEQPDGTFKSSPWYVRFGKFQGVLKAKEKMVNISVNDEAAQLHMYLDQRGEAYFMREVEEEGESVLSPLSSGDEMDVQSPRSRRPMKSKSCNYDGRKLNSDDKVYKNNGKVMGRSTSRRARILGLVFGRRSMKEDRFRGEDDGTGIARISSLERAEIAANLLEVKWTTDLATSRRRKNSASRVSALGDVTKPVAEQTTLAEDIGAGAEEPILITEEQVVESSSSAENIEEMLSEESRNSPEVTATGSPKVVEAFATEKPDNEQHTADERRVTSSSFGSSDGVQSSICCDTLDSLTTGLNGSGEHIQPSLYHASEGHRGVHFHLEALHSMDEQVSEETAIYQDVHSATFDKLHVNPNCLVGEVDSKSTCISHRDDFGPSLESGNDSVLLPDDLALTKCTSLPSSESSEEEQFLFNDLSEFKHREIKKVPNFQYGDDKENNPPDESDNSHSTVDEYAQENGSAEVEQISECTGDADKDRKFLKPEIRKKMARAITPTSEQVASLNLKEGRNTVTFTFSTKMLGKQQVEARIFLWKWNTRVVISDVDGTITKSDVLGQFMPLVGVDWSQTGVTQLFSAIEENGYQLLFLSARAITQAYITRRFLFNLKQNGKALPDGPVVISPDGLFPSLFREVIRRVPHEFKIACLETIKGLFPSDYNPFYAGFGNRDTDEFSYLKVGIPRGKIFIINPKGEVAVHRRVDTKSYTSLHALVHDMFPSMKSSEQEDFNSWNFWKLPPPLIDM